MPGKPQGPAIRRDCAHPNAQHVHGTASAYSRDGCRCDDCRAAHSREFRRRSRGIAYGTWRPRVPAVGSRRRLQALGTLGWGPPAIGARVGVSSTNLRRIRDGRAITVTAATVDAIKGAYDALWNTRPTPTTPAERGAVVQILNEARTHGWAAPLCWDDIDDPDEQPIINPAEDDLDVDDIDEIAVQEAMWGRRVTLTDREALEAVTRLTDAGYSVAEIAERLHTNARFVQRRRAKNRKDTAA
jgi:hypothetical protein